MIFNSEERFSGSPFVERIWYSHTERAGPFLSIAASHWEMVISKYHGNTVVTVRGPETKVTPFEVTFTGGEYIGIIFKHGAVLPYLPAEAIVDGDVDLPDASSKSFWLNGFAWQFPTYENADTFVDWLVRDGLLEHDPVVETVLQGQPVEMSIRSVQRHFLRATGLTHTTAHQIERARYVTALLKQGVPITEAAYQAGYFDQPHLTRSLKRFIGLTPAQIADQNRPERLSFLYKKNPSQLNYNTNVLKTEVFSDY